MKNHEEKIHLYREDKMNGNQNFDFNDMKDVFRKMKEERKKGARSNVTKGNFKNRSKDFRDKLREKDRNRKGLNPAIILLITLLIMFVNFFFTLPALNFMAPEFYAFLISGIVIFNILNILFGSASLSRTVIPSVLAVGLLIAVPAVLTFFSSPFFRAGAYSKLITVENAQFAETVKKITPDKIPVVDRDAAQMIGDKEMGFIPELVSQFDLDDNYTQLNVAGNPVRVSPLEYSDIFKYFANQKNGLGYYVSVNMANQEAELIKLENPLKYSRTDILMRNISRKLRFQFPTAMMGETNFEIDDSGKAYYTTPVLTKRIGFMNGMDVKGVIVTDGTTGQSQLYGTSEVPEWVDRVYPSELIINQLNMKGLYGGGFINSLFGQRNVTKTTEGYNYVPMDNDVYLYTGVTSVMKDSSNIGFYFVNLRTKESKFFSVPSADEISAMRSAEGAVKEKGYAATFPVLLNVQDKPVYLLSLKDNTMTAKMFALVDAAQFTNVSTGTTVNEALNKFSLMVTPTDNPLENAVEKTFTIAQIREAVIDGNTVLFIRPTEGDVIYIGTSKQLGYKGAFLKEGDTLKVFGNDMGEQFDILEIR